MLLQTDKTASVRSQSFPITPEQVGQVAGSVLPVGDPATWLPAGASSRQDYCLTLPTTENPQNADTSAQGLVQAATQITQGKYGLLPVQIDWIGERVLEILQLCLEHPQWSAVPLANLRTEHLWGLRSACSPAPPTIIEAVSSARVPP
ncbi:hypothetical protein [Pseudanabaena sp. FACHB-2040]|uniref:DUF6885 family protein n=1 Tax=Pseudanabaena sp. FACHB-2040 TaxID=2692859 RepID=UPI001681DDD9|nr:hypothetical protein [Pseudanabaena sp. FACHB-2040]MBD2256682.1 hypothetical protein [Pseudanabaena sp. FACHB-2040]